MQQKINVLFISGFQNNGHGSEVFSNDFLSNSRLNIKTYDPLKKKDNNFEDSFLTKIKKIILIVRQHKPKIILAEQGISIQLAYIVTLFYPNIKYISRYGNIIQYNKKPIFKKSGIKQKLLYKALCNSSGIIVPSDLAKNRILELGMASNKVKVIPNGVDLPLASSKCIFKTEEEKINALSVSSLMDRKAVHDAILGVSYLKNKININLDIFGSGGLREDLEELVYKLNVSDIVSFHGYQINPWKFSYKNSVLIHPAKYEGFGYVILEAIIRGIPVVVFKGCGGPEEIIKKTGGGIIVNDRNPQELGKAIMALFEDKESLQEKMKKAANYVEQHYTLDAMVKNYDQFIIKKIFDRS